MLINIIVGLLNALCGCYWVWQTHATGESAYILVVFFHCLIAIANFMCVK